jgi:hypothetical protein
MGLFASYAHDAEGQLLAQFVVEGLRGHGFPVTWDGDTDHLNLSSIQEWMERQIADSYVICILSKEYCERFGRGDYSSHRRGVLYESRAIELKLHDHTELADCPVIPVAPFGFPVNDIPAPLRRLHIVSVDPVTGQGIDKLVKRVQALSESSGVLPERPVGPQMSSVEGPRHSTPQPIEPEHRRLLGDLEAAQPGTAEARDVVLAWKAYGEQHPDVATTVYAQGFVHAERIVKTAGDLGLMREITDASLAAVDRSSRPLTYDLEFRARVLVYGSGWCLEREHKLREALGAMHEGVDLARRLHDRRTEAVGTKRLGRLELLLAEDLRGTGEAVAHLEASMRLLEEARQMLAGIEGEYSEEVGACISLQARSLLAYYRATGQRPLLTKAKERVAAADSIISPGTFKDYYDLIILRAEIDIADHRYTSARQHLRAVIGHLRKRPEAQCSELLAHALRVRGVLAARKAPKDIGVALRDLDEARKIFTDLGQEHSAAECQWQRIAINPSLVTRPQLARRDLTELEAEERDPRRRLAAIEMLSKDEEGRVGHLVAQRRHWNWKAILRRLDSER